MEIAIDKISVNSNPRTDFGNIDELAASVREKGIIEPLVVKKLDDKSYELVAGERRLRAAKAVGLKKVPVSIREGDSADIEEIKLMLGLMTSVRNRRMSLFSDTIIGERRNFQGQKEGMSDKLKKWAGMQ